MTVKAKRRVEFGDFQTPDVLACKVCEVLLGLGVSPRSIVEPTCGKGSFLRATVNTFHKCPLFLGFEVNEDYAQAARAVEKAKVHCENFFEKDWPRTLDSLQEPILVIGNPPWVTNSTVGTLNGTNLPIKSNFLGLKGFEAITGKSNFDVSEWMLVHLLKWLSGREAVLAMLCKTVVARKVLHYAWSRNVKVATSSIYSINARDHFGVSVDACLLVCNLDPRGNSKECTTYPDLDASLHNSTFALRDGRLVADLDATNTYSYLYGKESSLKWRSGIKHDCSRIMELWPRGGDTFENGLGEAVSLESNYLYPMLKSSELMSPHPMPSRVMLVTQGALGDDTMGIKHEAPQTWNYLQSHTEHLDGRASSIYRNRPRFSVFGVGPYSFAPWKVAISGFYKSLNFRCIGPFNGKPVVLDDTCYFLPAQNECDANLIVELLNSKAARGFFRSLIFWDAKRPITVQLLSSLNMEMLAKESGRPLPVWSDALEDAPLLARF